MQEIILASNNKGKIIEFKELLPNYKITSLKEAGFNIDIPENGMTLEANALTKAQEIYNLLKTPVLSDDSGLFVDSLHNSPGVFSARYAGNQHVDEDNIMLLLTNLFGCKNRKAFFKAIICLYYGPNQFAFFEGEVHGTIAEEKRGILGFGYDPIFIPNGYDVTFAEMKNEEKNSMSHRFQSTKKLLKNINIIL